MGLILRSPHNTLPAGATISGVRLTIQQMDNNFIFLQDLASGNSISLTNDEALDLINNNNVQQGVNYLITNAHPGLYGSASAFTYGLQGTNILLTGIDDSHFSTNGYGEFYNPNYASYSMWDPNNEYDINDAVIFGGQIWVNKTGNTGSTLGSGFDSSSFISLDSADWQVQSYTNSNYYNAVWDEVEYDIQNDFITSRYEAFNNNYVNNASKTFWFYCEINPIQSFRWGTTLGDIGNNVINCKVIDSYFGCLNYISGNIADIELTGFSWIYDMSLIYSGSLTEIKLSNNSGISTFSLNNAYISNLTLDNNSQLNNFTMVSSNIEYVTIKNNSYIDNFGLNSGTNLSEIELSNGSYIENFILHNSGCNMSDINLTNTSNINNFDLYDGSYLAEINLSNESSINNFELSDDNFADGSYFSYIDIINNSYISNVYLYNRSYLKNITISNNSTINGVYLCNNSGSDCYISNTEISNYSHLWDDDDTIYLNDSSYMDRIKIDLYSAITLVTMGGDSDAEIYMRDIIVSNHSLIDNISISSSGINTYFSSITLVDSNAQNISIANSYIDYVDITDGSIDSLNLSNISYIADVKINGGGITQYNTIVNSGDYIWLDNSYMQFITIDQSIISGYMLMNNSSLNKIHLSDFSTIAGGYSEYGDAVNDIGEYNYLIGLSSSNITDISLENNSIFGLGNITLANSAMNNLSFDNNSRIGGFIILNASTMSNFKLENNSYFGRGNDLSNNNSNSIQLVNNSTMNLIDMTNNAVIDGIIYMNNSSIVDITLSGIPDPDDAISTGDANNYDMDNGVGILFGGNLLMYDSYLRDFEITNGSYFVGLRGNQIYLESNSYIQGVKLDNVSIINNIMLNGSFMKEIEVLNGSYIYNINLQSGSSITYLSVSNYSFFGDYIYLQSNSYMTFIKIDNNSQIIGDSYGGWDDIYLYGGGSYFQNITIKNNSTLSDIILDNDGSTGGSYLRNIEISNNSYIARINPYNASYLDTILVSNNSGIDSIWLCDSSGSNAYMNNIIVTNNSYISDDGDYIYIEDGGYMSTIYLNNGSYLSGYLEMHNGSYMYDVKLENSSFFGYGIYIEADSHISYISLDNNSYIEGNLLMVASYIEYITMRNNSYIEGDSEIFGVYISNLDLINVSSIYNLNMSNSAILYSKLSNNSIIYSNILTDNSTLEYINLDNSSSIYNNSLDNSNIEYINLQNSVIHDNGMSASSGFYDLVLSDSQIYSNILNSSQLGDIQMSDSDIYNNTLSNSYLADLVLNASSEIHDSTLVNSSINVNELYSGSIHNMDMNLSHIVGSLIRTSLLDTITLTSSSIEDIELINNSSITNSFFTDGNFYGCSLKSSNINTINSYGIEFLYMRDANFSAYNSTASIYNLNMIGSSFNFNGDSSYVIPNYTSFDTNTIKYQFSITFNGSVGYGQIGAVYIPKMLSPLGFFIESVIVDNSNTGQSLVFAGTYSIINIGNTTDSDTGLDNSKGDVASMRSRITVSDISNGGADGMKTSNFGNIVMNIEGNDITSGIIYVEIILKNTNYGTNND